MLCPPPANGDLKMPGSQRSVYSLRMLQVHPWGIPSTARHPLELRDAGRAVSPHSRSHPASRVSGRCQRSPAAAALGTDRAALGCERSSRGGGALGSRGCPAVLGALPLCRALRYSLTYFLRRHRPASRSSGRGFLLSSTTYR